MMELYILIGLAAAAVILLIVLLFRSGRARPDAALSLKLDLLSRQGEQQRTRDAELQRLLADEFERGRRESAAFQSALREETRVSLDAVAARMSELRRENAEALHRLQDGNERKLEQMRQTVDEKLTATLNARLESSFKTVSEQLNLLYASLGEMKELSGGVTSNVQSLSRILTNVKARGTWAEVQLDALLEQTIPGMYERNFTVPGTRDQVEFAMRIPTGDTNADGSRRVMFLPVDSKFPMENYIRLQAAADAGDPDALRQARRALEDQLLHEARTIRDKYIKEPVTTPYAILYLATEGLYAEAVSSRSGLLERVQRDCGVMLAGPATIMALLNSLSLGYRAVAINEKATEIHRLLAAVRAQYGKFTDLIAKAKRKIDEAGKTLDAVEYRNNQIQKRLRAVESMDAAQADALLLLPEEGGDAEEAGEPLY